MNDILIKKFRAPLYGSRIWIVACKSIHKAIDTIEDMIHFRITKESDKSFLDAYTYGNLDGTNYCHIIIFVRTGAAPGRIAHECDHARNILFNYHGVRRSRSNDEHESHYLEFLVDKAHEAINCLKKSLKKKLTKDL